MDHNKLQNQITLQLLLVQVLNWAKKSASTEELRLCTVKVRQTKTEQTLKKPADKLVLSVESQLKEVYLSIFIMPLPPRQTN